MDKRELLKILVRALILGGSSWIVIGWSLIDILRLVLLFAIMLRVTQCLEHGGRKKQEMLAVYTKMQLFSIHREGGRYEGLEITIRVATRVEKKDNTGQGIK
jgi:hypothetical protein